MLVSALKAATEVIRNNATRLATVVFLLIVASLSLLKFRTEISARSVLALHLMFVPYVLDWHKKLPGFPQMRWNSYQQVQMTRFTN
jgi:hypothetical protein